MTTDMFGIKYDDLEQARNIIEAAFNFTLEAHESSYRGGLYYFLRLEEGCEYALQKNYSQVDDEFIYDEFKDFPVIFFCYQHGKRT